MIFAGKDQLFAIHLTIMILVLCNPAQVHAVSNVPLEVWATNGTVDAIVSDGTTTYLGGDFTLVVGGFYSAIGGELRSQVASLNPMTGVALGWRPNLPCWETSCVPPSAFADNATSTYLAGWGGLAAFEKGLFADGFELGDSAGWSSSVVP